MEEILKRFAADCRTRGLADITVSFYVAYARQYLAFLDGKPIPESDRMDVRGHVEELQKRGNTMKSIRYHLAALSSLYDCLILEGLAKNNPVVEVRRSYMQRYKADGECSTHKAISEEEASRLVSCLVDVRDKAAMMLLLKTGIRKSELISLDVENVRWADNSILLKNNKKRTNRMVFFDEETAYYLRRWMAAREGRTGATGKALFLNTRGERLKRGGIDHMVRNAAVRAGLHDTKSPRMEDHFSAHCCRHTWTTWLLQAGMRREYVQWLRGDAIREAMDIYFHVDPEDVRRSYLACIPQLGL